MSIQDVNEVRTIVSIADSLRVKLPKEIADGVAHLEEFRRNTTVTPHAGHAAREIVPLLGKPAAFDKARQAAALEQAMGEALAKIDGHIVEAGAGRMIGLIRRERETICAAIGEALSPDLATLQANAGKLPELFRPEHAADLDPHTFALWTEASEAFSRVHATAVGLSSLYRGATGQDSSEFSAPMAVALRFAKPGKLRNPPAAYRLRSALAGRAERSQGLAGQGSTFVDGLFVPTTLAHAGASFEWATPSQIAPRAAAITEAIVPAKAGTLAPALATF